MTEPTIDRATYDELKDTAGADFVAELVDTFLVEAPRLIDELRRRVRQARRGRLPALRALAQVQQQHVRRADARRRLAKDLELGGFAPVVKASGEPLNALAQEYARVAAALAELRNA